MVCHGDLHPLNLLAVGTNVTAVIDWTGARLADPAYDVACTAVLLAQAPLAAPAVVQPALRAVGRSLARRFVKQYRRHEAISTPTSSAGTKHGNAHAASPRSRTGVSPNHATDGTTHSKRRPTASATTSNRPPESTSNYRSAH